MNTTHEVLSVAQTISLALSNAGKRYREGKRIPEAVAGLRRECQELRYDIGISSTELSAFGYAHRVTAWNSELEAAEDYLQKVNEKTTTAQERGRVRERLQRTALALRAERSKEDLDHVIEIISGIRNAFGTTVAEIERRMTLSSSSSIQQDLLFEEHYARPVLPNHRLTFLENREGKLRALLVTEPKESSCAPVYCVQGPGGMGKTVALKLMCRDERVRERYVDGIHWLSIGEDATDRNILSEVSRCAADAGHTELEGSLRNEERVGTAVSRLAKIFEGKTVLFVLDDVWSNRKSLIRSFRELVEGGFRSSLLVSTREETIAETECHETVKFNFLEIQSSGSRELLMSSLNEQQRADLEDWVQSDAQCQRYLEQALSECGGWILCLSIASAVLKELIKDCVGQEDAVQALSSWVHELCEEMDISERVAPMYDNSLSKVVLQGLKRCEETLEWTLNSSESVNLQFWKLGVLKKGKLIPTTVVCGLWGMSAKSGRKNALQLMRALQDMSLIELVRGDDHEKCLRLHDKVIDLCRARAGDELPEYHRILLRSFLDDSQAMKWSSNIPYRPWWSSSLKNSYIIENLGYHLENAQLREELWCVVTDARWVLRWLGDGHPWQCMRDMLDRSVYEGANISDEDIEGLHRIQRALGECWVEIKSHRSTLGFNLLARLTPESSLAERRFLQSINEFNTEPWLRPLQPFERRRDRRETASFRFPGTGSFRGRFVSHDFRLISGPRQLQNSRGVARCVWSIFDVEQQEFTKDIYIPPLWKHATVLTVNSDGYVTVSSYNDELFLADGKRNALFALKLEGNEAVALCADLSCDSNLVVGYEDGKLRVVHHDDVARGTQAHEEKREAQRPTSGGEKNCTLSRSKDEDPCVWDVLEVAENCICILAGHDAIVNCVAWNTDGTLVASGSDDQTVRIWEVNGGKGREAFVLTGHHGDVSCVSWSADGKRVASGSFDRTVRIWDVSVDRGDMLISLLGHSSSVRQVAWSPDGTRIVSGSDDRTICVWDANGTENILLNILTGHTSGIRCLRFSADGSRLASTSWDQTVKFWNVRSRCICSLKENSTREDGDSSLAFSGNGKFLASLSGRGVAQIWSVDADMGPGKRKTIASCDIRCLAMDAEGTRLASGMRDGTIHVWDLNSAEARSIFSGICGRDPVKCVTLSADGSRAGAACFSKAIRLWDMNGGQRSVAVTLNGPGYHIESLGLSADLQWIVVCTAPSWDEAVTVWYARINEQRLKWTRIARLSFEDSEVQVAVGSELQKLPFPGGTLISYRRRYESVSISRESEHRVFTVTYADLVVISFRDTSSCSYSKSNCGTMRLTNVEASVSDKDGAGDGGVEDCIGESSARAVHVNDIVSVQTPWVVDSDRVMLRGNNNFITLGQFEGAECHASLWGKGVTAHGMRDGRIVICQLMLPAREYANSDVGENLVNKTVQKTTGLEMMRVFIEWMQWLQRLFRQLFTRITERRTARACG